MGKMLNTISLNTGPLSTQGIGSIEPSPPISQNQETHTQKFKITKTVTTRFAFQAWNAQKCICGWGLTG